MSSQTVPSEALVASANALLDEMQRVYEASSLPLAYKDDFYKYDRDEVARSFAPGITLAWLIRPHGTALGRLGVFRSMECPTLSALKFFVEQSHELHLIDVAMDGSWAIKHADTRRVLEEHAQRAAATGYSFEMAVNGHAAMILKAGARLAFSSLRSVPDPDGAPASRMSARVATEIGRPLLREEVLAIGAVVDHQVRCAQQSLFASPAALLIDGVPIADMAPPLPLKALTPSPPEESESQGGNVPREGRGA